MNVKTGGEMTFLDHLESLRKVLLKILGAFALLFFPAWFASPYVVKYLLDTSAPKGFKLHYFTLMEPFFLQMKTALALDLIVLFPVVVLLIWNFVRPGLTGREIATLKIPVLSSFFLAVGGIAFALYFIIPAMVRFSLSFAGPEMEPVIGIDSFISMILFCVLASALLFQFPLILQGLLATGAVRLETLKKHRPAVIVILLFLAAILTPPDVLSQILLFVPTYFLFELTILLNSLHGKKDEKNENS